MEHVTVQGEQVPALGLGTWLLRGDGCTRATRAALELGYRHVDTAQAYGNEAEIGEVLASSGIDREQLFLTTKIWNSNHEPRRVVSSTETSLRRLRTDYVDLLLIHWPGRPEDTPRTLEAMCGLADQGKVRHVGVSNFPPDLLVEAIEHAPIFCDQVEFHPYLGQDDLLALARKHDVMVTAYSPLARGRILGNSVLREIADAHGKTPAQVALRWLVDQDHVAAIPKSRSRERLAENLSIFDFSLTDADRERITGLDRAHRQIDPPFAPDWGR